MNISLHIIFSSIANGTKIDWGLFCSAFTCLSIEVLRVISTWKVTHLNRYPPLFSRSQNTLLIPLTSTRNIMYFLYIYSWYILRMPSHFPRAFKKNSYYKHELKISLELCEFHSLISLPATGIKSQGDPYKDTFVCVEHPEEKVQLHLTFCTLLTKTIPKS